MKRYKEDDLQRAVAQMLDSLGWLWWHTPNGGWRSKIEASRFKSLGVKPGVADIIIAERWVCPDHHGLECELCDGIGMAQVLAIELKTKRGRVTEYQRAWLCAARLRGWATFVCRDIDEVASIIRGVQPYSGYGFLGLK